MGDGADLVTVNRGLASSARSSLVTHDTGERIQAHMKSRIDAVVRTDCPPLKGYDPELILVVKALPRL